MAADLYGRICLGWGVENCVLTFSHVGHHYEYSYLSWQ